MARTVRQLIGFSLATALAVPIGSVSSVADPVADFYKSRPLVISVGVAPGGGYDTQARLVGRHMGQHIPGNPTIVVQNNPGAGGLRNVKFLHEAAPRDGSLIGAVTDSTPLAQVLKFPGADYDSKEFSWIGSIAPTIGLIIVWHTSPVRSIEDARNREVIAGSNGKGVATSTFPALFNHFAGTKFKIVTGYSGGSEINIAMERGEVDARFNAWDSLKATNPDWIAEKKVTIIAQVGPRSPQITAPSLIDFAKTDEDRQVINLIASRLQLGRPLATPPAVPQDRVAALRKGFLATMQDGAFREQAAKLSLEVDPVPGEELQKIVAELLTAPDAVAKQAQKILDW